MHSNALFDFNTRLTLFLFVFWHVAAICCPSPCRGTLWSASELQFRNLKWGQWARDGFLYHWWTIQVCSFKLGLAGDAGISLLPSAWVAPCLSFATVQLMWLLRLLALQSAPNYFMSIVSVSGQLHCLSIAISLLAVCGKEGSWIQTALVKDRHLYLFLVTLKIC